MPNSKKEKLKKYFKITAVTIGLLVAGFLIVTKVIFPDLASEVAMPIETALIKAGAIKKCGDSSSGYFGFDSSTPGYAAYFEIPMDRKATQKLVTGIAKDNGFNLQQASLTNTTLGLPEREDLIGNWLFDVSRVSYYSQLQPGKMKLLVALDNNGNFTIGARTCGHNKEPLVIHNDANHTALTIRLYLPNVR